MTDYGSFIKGIGDTEYKIGENLGKYSSYGTGGDCDIMVFPESTEKLKLCLSLLKESPFILGNGSNILVSDKGYCGAVINTSKLDKITVKGNLVIAECGAKLSKVISSATENSLSGLEFAVGVPASVGGAVCMNAGCFGKSISDYICYVKSSSGTYNAQNCNFSYRNSRFGVEAILEVCFKLKAWDYDTIEAKLEHYKKIRGSKAPKGRSCGSVFKNEEYFAGKIIDEAGLKGYSIGGAKISEKHANYILIERGATSQNIYDLIKTVKKRVQQSFGIELKEELRFIGEFNGDKI